jgi:hypothetical protein
VDRKVFHVALLIAKFAHRLPKLGLVWPRMVKTLCLQSTLARLFGRAQGASVKC